MHYCEHYKVEITYNDKNDLRIHIHAEGQT